MVPQGISADLIATLEGFTREELDAFALRASSQGRAPRSQQGRFAGASSPCKTRRGQIVLEHDEYPRAGTTVEALGQARASFEALGAYRRPERARSFDEMALRALSAGWDDPARAHTPATPAASSTARGPC